MTFLTHDEYHRFLACVPACWRPLVMTLFTTGLRWGEVAALKVGDVDLNDAYLRVARAWKETESGAVHVTGAPKSAAGRRIVALAPEVVAALKPVVDGRSGDAWLLVGKKGEPSASRRSTTWSGTPRCALQTVSRPSATAASVPAPCLTSRATSSSPVCARRIVVEGQV